MGAIAATICSKEDGNFINGAIYPVHGGFPFAVIGKIGPIDTVLSIAKAIEIAENTQMAKM